MNVLNVLDNINATQQLTQQAHEQSTRNSLMLATVSLLSLMAGLFFWTLKSEPPATAQLKQWTQQLQGVAVQTPIDKLRLGHVQAVMDLLMAQQAHAHHFKSLSLLGNSNHEALNKVKNELLSQETTLLAQQKPSHTWALVSVFWLVVFVVALSASLYLFVSSERKRLQQQELSLMQENLNIASLANDIRDLDLSNFKPFAQTQGLTGNLIQAVNHLLLGLNTPLKAWGHLQTLSEPRDIMPILLQFQKLKPQNFPTLEPAPISAQQWEEWVNQLLMLDDKMATDVQTLNIYSKGFQDSEINQILSKAITEDKLPATLAQKKRLNEELNSLAPLLSRWLQQTQECKTASSDKNDWLMVEEGLNALFKEREKWQTLTALVRGQEED